MCHCNEYASSAVSQEITVHNCKNISNAVKQEVVEHIKCYVSTVHNLYKGCVVSSSSSRSEGMRLALKLVNFTSSAQERKYLLMWVLYAKSLKRMNRRVCVSRCHPPELPINDEARNETYCKHRCATVFA